MHSDEAIMCSTFVRTVGVILHASAPSALDLREMIREYWDLSLSMSILSSDPAALESVLFRLLVNRTENCSGTFFQILYPDTGLNCPP